MASAGTPISGCVICYQEADRIVDCVRSLAFCDEVVVVDSGSTDGTRELAAGLGARVLVNTPFPGHREQKQFAVEQARHDFVFCLDADERCTPELAAQVRAKAAAGLTADAYEMPRHNHYLGRISKHGLFVPDRKIRLFDRRRARWGGRNPHDHVELAEGRAANGSNPASSTSATATSGTTCAPSTRSPGSPRKHSPTKGAAPIRSTCWSGRRRCS